MDNEGNKGFSLKKLAIVGLIIFALGVTGYLIVVKGGVNGSSGKTAPGNSADKNKYQAVFLTSGQVYFGKLTDDGGNYVKLNDIYYLQTQEKVQPKDSKDTSTSSSDLTLIKLGKELHAPADEMNISREQVLFWENIQDDGKVGQAIKDYKTSNK
ncbi:MAG: hypothetical protein Q7K29_04940 [Thermoleophilia bacterium]|nr:hypothetical protein [Thermoleophilia bacterium]